MDGSQADTGDIGDKLSPTTFAWLEFVEANPGAVYPEVLKTF